MGGDLESRDLTEKSGDPETNRLHVRCHVLSKRDGIIKTVIIFSLLANLFSFFKFLVGQEKLTHARKLLAQFKVCFCIFHPYPSRYFRKCHFAG